MKPPSYSLAILIGAALVGVSGASGRLPGDLRGQTDKPAVVRNSRKPAKPAGGHTRFLLVDELTIGRGADDNSRFAELRSVQADSEGCLYALDGRDCLIKVFDPEGRFLRTIGKKGQGPGEFSAPSRIILTLHDEIAVLDVGNRRLSFFNRDGGLIKELSTARWRFLRFRVGSRGDIYADHASVTEQGAVNMQMSRFSPDLSSMATLATEPRTMAPDRINPFSAGFQHGVTSDGGLAWAVDTRYEITVVDPQGHVRLKIFKDAEPNPLGEEDRKAIIEEDYRGLPAGVTVEFPSHYPPIRTLVVTDTDHIFVRTYVKDDQGRSIHDVFDPSGRFVAQFALGEEEFAMMARNGKLYTLVREDAEGIPLVKRYRMVWE